MEVESLKNRIDIKCKNCGYNHKWVWSILPSWMNLYGCFNCNHIIMDRIPKKYDFNLDEIFEEYKLCSLLIPVQTCGSSARKLCLEDHLRWRFKSKVLFADPKKIDYGYISVPELKKKSNDNLIEEYLIKINYDVEYKERYSYSYEDVIKLMSKARAEVHKRYTFRERWEVE